MGIEGGGGVEGRCCCCGGSEGAEDEDRRIVETVGSWRRGEGVFSRSGSMSVSDIVLLVGMALLVDEGEVGERYQQP